MGKNYFVIVSRFQISLLRLLGGGDTFFLKDIRFSWTGGTGEREGGEGGGGGLHIQTGFSGLLACLLACIPVVLRISWTIKLFI